MVTKKEVVSKRRKLMSLAEKSHSFNKGDKRVHTPRVCVVCGRPLSSLIINENKYIIIQAHTRYHLNELFIVDACTDITSCYRTLRQKGELIENVNG
ncbi:hypothetical protein BCP78_0010 [Bacillus phage BCP78]|uniref:Uncharacterized protein n=3 Tax=Tsarbombavirus BCP78 TaxID=1985182 RepID=J9PRJ7_9CAUD|nr:hypothetical protein BCP78_0010 [Bacillus phage BCP78]YP_009783376.1 hypothetical protein QLX27_gp003 [Bacillus phage BCU4]ALA07603.1 hypothetical protein PBC6_010 [Bacillus phage PBC6]AQN32613.1 hypothetical protein BCP12_213 [Bacillus phage BCP12]AXU41108.1 hypothetical protein BC01_011 [Bacillus phage BC01]QEG13562.1 hypothetical protein MARVELLAND_31 [Bacillus phage vB_BspM_MarvelLand]AEW47017.1 hypothetical protein BCP78_0010 [Bacillus phage BCP78]